MRPYLVGETGIITIALIVVIAIICAWKYHRTGGENVAEVSEYQNKEASSRSTHPQEAIAVSNGLLSY